MSTLAIGGPAAKHDQFYGRSRNGGIACQPHKRKSPLSRLSEPVEQSQMVSPESLLRVIISHVTAVGSLFGNTVATSNTGMHIISVSVTVGNTDAL